ncbi:MAG TPA: glycoside hydrolase family 3 N-terminal domain-containing protein [Gryllotalpicola sp.]
MSSHAATASDTDAASTAPWHDTSRALAERVDALIAELTPREKLAQLYGVWVGASPVGGDVAPFQHEMGGDVELDELLPYGLGQLTRPFGSAPVDPAVGLVSLARTQQRIMSLGRFGVPAIAHEECLAGFTAWRATAYPIPLSWGATFDPALVERMTRRIGAGMRALGIHQGLAPVLDVARDLRWGRVEETIGEDPYLVGTIATAYIRGLESAGVIATLKHFLGYSASKAGRNHAPVEMGPREFNDVVVPPFEMAVRESGVRSVMAAYTDVDGIPTHGDPALLTGLLREDWGFSGTVVADYFGVAFLHTMHHVARDLGDAAAQALTAGVDVELPSVNGYAEPLLAELAAGRLDEAVIDRALRRVLTQKAELGMLDADWSPLPAGWSEADLADPDAARGRIELDTAEDRTLAREIAERAVVLLANDGTLPLGAASGRRILVVGPNADDALNLLGCYSFPGHVGTLHPEVPLGIELPTVLEALRAEFPAATIEHLPGVTVDGPDAGGIPPAVAAARAADLVIAVLGDRPGLFGRGTSGEGCDAAELRLPGRQQELLDALLDTGTPVVAALVLGRPYALGTAPERAAAIVAAFFPGEEGGSAIAGVLSGRVNPSGRLPVSIPRHPGSQPTTYLGATLALEPGASNLDQQPRYPFGHGLSYSAFEWSTLTVDGRPAPPPSIADADGSAGAGAPAPIMATAPTDGRLSVGLTVRNVSERAGRELVQLYLHDPVASVVRPMNRLIGYAHVMLAPGAAKTVGFEVPADVTAFTGRDGARIVEPGELELRLGPSSGELRLAASVALTGPVRVVDHTRELHCTTTVSD